MDYGIELNVSNTGRIQPEVPRCVSAIIRLTSVAVFIAAGMSGLFIPILSALASRRRGRSRCRLPHLEVRCRGFQRLPIASERPCRLGRRLQDWYAKLFEYPFVDSRYRSRNRHSTQQALSGSKYRCSDAGTLRMTLA